MPYIELSQKYSGDNRIMIFTEGTILKPKSIFTLYSHRSYIPIGNCVKIIEGWQLQDIDIVYCTSLKKQQAQVIADLLKQYGFIGSRLYYRERGQQYKDIVEEVLPDILIEDDCRSIGGSWQMCITHIDKKVKDRIKSVVVKEFKGIDHLPTNLLELYRG
jgi:hypothetical protein